MTAEALARLALQLEQQGTYMSEAAPLCGTVIVEYPGAASGLVVRRAAAMAGRIAADLGAEVVKIEPSGGDPLRHEPPFVRLPNGRIVGAAHLFLDAGKRSLTVADTLEGNALVSALARCATAVLTSDDDQVQGLFAATPVKVLIGHGVPAGLGVPEKRVTDATILALSGLMDLIGHPTAAPVALGGHQASHLAGLAAFSGLAAAVAAHRAGAAGETVRVSALEACQWSNWKSYAERLYLGRTPSRQGSLSEWQALPCADGYVALVFLEKDWPALARLIGDPRLMRPPLDTQAGRRADMGAVYEIFRPWFHSRTRAEIYRAAKAAGLPIAPVLSVGELADDRGFAAQRFLAVPVGCASDWAARVPTVPVVWDGARFQAAAGLDDATSHDEVRR